MSAPTGLIPSPNAVPTMPGPISGNYYDVLTVNTTAARGDQLLTANRLYLEPVLLGSCLMDRIAFGVNIAVAASTARLGIYTESSPGQFSLLIDGGEVSTASTGDKSVTISQSWRGGLLFVGLLPSAAITASAWIQTAQHKIFGHSTPNSLSRDYGVYDDLAGYGALPTTAVIDGYITTNGPVIQVRVA